MNEITDPGLSGLLRAIKARQQAIRRSVRVMPDRLCKELMPQLLGEFELLGEANTAVSGVQRRPTTPLPGRKSYRTHVPTSKGGKRHVPVKALPLNARGQRRIPSVRDIVETAVFQKFAKKGNIAMALAKLAAINPDKYAEIVQKEASRSDKVRRALNRVGSDVSIGWPPKDDEVIILENFYATKVLSRPLCGMACDNAAALITEKFPIALTPDRYRRILGKFLLV